MAIKNRLPSAHHAHPFTRHRERANELNIIISIPFYNCCVLFISSPFAGLCLCSFPLIYANVQFCGIAQFWVFLSDCIICSTIFLIFFFGVKHKYTDKSYAHNFQVPFACNRIDMEMPFYIKLKYGIIWMVCFLYLPRTSMSVPSFFLFKIELRISATNALRLIQHKKNGRERKWTIQSSRAMWVFFRKISKALNCWAKERLSRIKGATTIWQL